MSLIEDEDGTVIGYTNEWSDISAQVRAEEAINDLVKSASSGDLRSRITIDSEGTFLSSLAQSINELLDIVLNATQDVTKVAEEMAKGNLTETVKTDYSGVFGELKSAINSSITNLSEMVGRIGVAAASIKSSASEIAIGNGELSHRTEEQASSLEETSSSLEEFTTAVKQTAANAARASELSVEASDVAEKGGEVVAEAVMAMTAINESSRQISEIISVIDEISFQTNLLALNAAVEAARAGDQGRGFAVVAGEVRNLAQRSATAAKEIKALISDSVARVQQGSDLVDRSGETLQEIVRGVQQVTSIVGEIAIASREQAQGIDEVAKAVAQIDGITQQNAAMVEEATAAAASMDEQASGLAELMAFFRTHARTQTKEAPKSRPTVKSGDADDVADLVSDYATVSSGEGEDEWAEF